MKFSRDTNLNYDKLSLRYRMSFDNSVASNQLIPSLGFTIKAIDKKTFNLVIDISQFSGKVKGKIQFWMKDEYRLSLMAGARLL